MSRIVFPLKDTAVKSEIQKYLMALIRVPYLVTWKEANMCRAPPSLNVGVASVVFSSSSSTRWNLGALKLFFK